MNIGKSLLVIGIIWLLAGSISCGKQEASDKPSPPARASSGPAKPDGGAAADIKMGAAKVVPLSDPTLVFDEDEFNFGSATMGSQLTHTFNFYNTGSQDLVIIRVRHT